MAHTYVPPKIWTRSWGNSFIDSAYNCWKQYLNEHSYSRTKSLYEHVTNVAVCHICTAGPNGELYLKIKVTPWHVYADTEGWRRWSSYPFATCVLEGVSGQHHASAVLPLETPGIHCAGGWAGLWAGKENLAPKALLQVPIVPTTLHMTWLQPKR